MLIICCLKYSHPSLTARNISSSFVGNFSNVKIKSKTGTKIRKKISSNNFFSWFIFLIHRFRRKKEGKCVLIIYIWVLFSHVKSQQKDRHGILLLIQESQFQTILGGLTTACSPRTTQQNTCIPINLEIKKKHGKIAAATSCPY